MPCLHFFKQNKMFKNNECPFKLHIKVIRITGIWINQNDCSAYFNKPASIIMMQIKVKS